MKEKSQQRIAFLHIHRTIFSSFFFNITLKNYFVRWEFNTKIRITKTAVKSIRNIMGKTYRWPVGFLYYINEILLIFYFSSIFFYLFVFFFLYIFPCYFLVSRQNQKFSRQTIDIYKFIEKCIFHWSIRFIVRLIPHFKALQSNSLLNELTHFCLFVFMIYCSYCFIEHFPCLLYLCLILFIIYSVCLGVGRTVSS